MTSIAKQSLRFSLQRDFHRAACPCLKKVLKAKCCTHLGSAAKQLAEDALLDIIKLPDAGGYAACQLLIDVRICSKLLSKSMANHIQLKICLTQHWLPCTNEPPFFWI